MTLHIVTFRFRSTPAATHCSTVLVRGVIDQRAAMKIAGEQGARQGREPWLSDLRSVPAPRPTPALDALCARLTAFPTFLALLTATAGYRPLIRLDLAGRDGLALGRAYDRMQARWGDPRRAFVTGEIAETTNRAGRHAG
jgi:hypothetical protein